MSTARDRARNRRRGQPNNPGQFAKEPSTRAGTADVHDVDLGPTPESASPSEQAGHGFVIGVPAEDGSGCYLLRGSADGAPVLASVPGPADYIACTLSYGVGTGQGWDDAVRYEQLISGGWRSQCDPNVVNPHSWNAGWDQGVVARQWHEREESLKARWQEEHRDLSPQQRSDLEAHQQADVDVFKAITAEARKTRRQMEKLRSEVMWEIRDGKDSATRLLLEGRHAVAESVASAGFNLLPPPEEIHRCDPDATYVRVSPASVMADGSRATLGVWVGHLEIDPDMPEWDPVVDPSVGINIDTDDYFKSDSYMQLVLQADGAWQTPEHGVLLRSDEQDALGLLG